MRISRHRQREFLLCDDIKKFSFDGIIALIITLATSMLFAAILAPLLFNLVLFFEKNYHSRMGAYLINKGLGAFFDRIRWIPIAIGMVILNKKFKFTKNIFIGKFRWSQISRGFSMGMAFIVLAASPHYFLTSSQRTISQPENITMTLINALGTSIRVAFLEEIIFRNILLKIFYTAFRPSMAITLASMFFAYMHFKGHTSLASNDYATIKNGLLCAHAQITCWATGLHVIEFLNLFLLGLLLCLITLKRKSLDRSMGTHCGIVFSLLIYKKFVHITPPPQSFAFFGTHRITDSPFGLLILSLIILAIHWKRQGNADQT
ncbi:MAG: CPBP family intramembrane metalloprotease [Puniceicoccales bacterium]|jgi:membrane protease YdiL (CAAX protease family)|nr:CPBP family intramembrane metalloprotease [Puniceicoccales bacterium]